MLNKKGIMVKFLTTLILAMIIFVPACMFVSNLFKISDQALDSFNDFSEGIEQFVKGVDGQVTTQLLILDEDSLVVLFKENKNINITEQHEDNVKEGRITETYYYAKKYVLNYPQTKCSDKPCLCLCQDYEIKPELVCKNLDCKVYSEINFAENWYTKRRPGDLRRITVTLTKQNGLVNISGGIKIEDVKK
jgi:hypothetical protein